MKTALSKACWLLVALCALPVASYAQSRAYNDKGDSRAEGPISPVQKEVTVIENLGQKLPLDLAFTDQNGKAVTLGDFFKDNQRPKVITPVYYSCPTLCTTVLQGVVGTLKASGLRLGDDYDIITYSIDPKETPAQAYEKRLKLIHDLGYNSSVAEWPFLVGNEVNTRVLSESLGFRYKYDADIKQYAHAASFMVLTPEGVISRYIYGVRFPPKDVRLSLVEASQGKTGTAFDRFLLTCYRFDPASRRYEIVVATVIKGGGSLVFLALATMLFVFWRREFKYGSGRKPGSVIPPEGAKS